MENYSWRANSALVADLETLFCIELELESLAFRTPSRFSGSAAAFPTLVACWTRRSKNCVLLGNSSTRGLSMYRRNSSLVSLFRIGGSDRRMKFDNFFYMGSVKKKCFLI